MHGVFDWVYDLVLGEKQEESILLDEVFQPVLPLPIITPTIRVAKEFLDALNQQRQDGFSALIERCCKEIAQCSKCDQLLLSGGVSCCQGSLYPIRYAALFAQAIRSDAPWALVDIHAAMGVDDNIAGRHFTEILELIKENPRLPFMRFFNHIFLLSGCVRGSEDLGLIYARYAFAMIKLSLNQSLEQALSLCDVLLPLPSSDLGSPYSQLLVFINSVLVPSLIGCGAEFKVIRDRLTTKFQYLWCIAGLRSQQDFDCVIETAEALLYKLMDSCVVDAREMNWLRLIYRRGELRERLVLIVKDLKRENHRQKIRLKTKWFRARALANVPVPEAKMTCADVIKFKWEGVRVCLSCCQGRKEGDIHEPLVDGVDYTF